MDLNRIVLIGNLARDPELRYLPSGDAKAVVVLAVRRPPRGNGDRETDLIDCVAWRKQAEILSEHARKGESLAVEGRLTVRTYTDKDGAQKKVVEVTLTDFSFSHHGRARMDPPDGPTSPPPSRTAPPETASQERAPHRSARVASRPTRDVGTKRETPGLVPIRDAILAALEETRTVGALERSLEDAYSHDTIRSTMRALVSEGVVERIQDGRRILLHRKIRDATGEGQESSDVPF